MSNTEIVENPLLKNVRMPGLTFTLPSHGLFYHDQELDSSVVNGKVEVYPMVTLDEIIISTPDKLLSGKALIEVFSRCIPQIKKPEKLLIKDVDFLMAALRIVSFGDTMIISHTHSCDVNKPISYEVNITDLVKKAVPIDPTTLNQQYDINLSNGQVVRLRPLVYQDVIELYQIASMTTQSGDILPDEAEKIVINGLAALISSVDEINDRQLIKQWLHALPLKIRKEIDTTARNLAPWGVDFTIDVKCKNCKKPTKLSIAPNPVSFFS